MAITIHEVKCPSCNANLPIEEGRKMLYCAYCGTQITVTDDNEYTYRYIDEAQIVQSDNNKAVRMRELDIAEKRGTITDTFKMTLIKIWLIVSIALLVIAVGIMLFAGDDGGMGFLFFLYVVAPVAGGGAYLLFKVMPEKENERTLKKSGAIRFPTNLEPFNEQNYEVIQNALQHAGFTNISCLNMHDLTFGLLVKHGTVEKVMVNGQEITSGGKLYMPNVQITITYHGR